MVVGGRPAPGHIVGDYLPLRQAPLWQGVAVEELAEIEAAARRHIYTRDATSTHAAR